MHDYKKFMSPSFFALGRLFCKLNAISHKNKKLLMPGAVNHIEFYINTYGNIRSEKNRRAFNG
jgi:hypothetical protein